ncbi:MAG TPA: acetylornithine transaminase [Candidatus Dormibacteraeota bacterium]|nr:acetylornithine transaminase [Candidatus Dormibacteraeota bacterium]
MTALSVAEREAAALCSTYRRSAVTLVRGSGSFVETDDGRRLLDLVGGIAVNVLGHCHPEVVAAATAQLSRLSHTSNLYYTEPQLELAEALIGSAFPGRVFLCNSGAEANEAAIKVARKWGQLRRQGAHTIVTLEGAFHGRTLATLAATGNPHYSDPFRPLPEGFRQVPRGDLGAVERALSDPERRAVAVLAEPLQGESGVHPLADDYLRGLRELCDRHQALLILDEIQTGMGRTGTMWAHEAAGIRPDVMTAAKGLGGGLPLGAMLVSEIADVLEPGDHGSTFGGNPVAAAAGVAVFGVIQRHRLWERAATAGDQLKEAILGLRLEGLPVVEVRGRGLLLGVALERPIAVEVGRAALEEGLLVNPVGAQTIRLAPSLLISDDEIEQAVQGIRRSLTTAVATA